MRRRRSWSACAAPSSRRASARSSRSATRSSRRIPGPDPLARQQVVNTSLGPERTITRSEEMKRNVVAMAVTGALVLAVAGCGGESDPSAPHETAPGFLAVADQSATAEGPVTIQMGFDASEVGGYDPQAAVNGQSWALYGLVYEPLVDVDENFNVVPRLASSWEQPDDTTYIFTIDTRATFSNGRALTVDDVVGSLNRLREGGTAWGAQVSSIASVTALDDQRVEVELSEPYTPLLAALANNPASILPMKEVEAGEIDLATEMLGTGPFVVKSHRQDKEWTFSRNAEYRNVKDVHITELQVEIATNEATRQAALREGSIAMTTFSGVDAVRLLANSGASVYSQQQTDFFTLSMNSLRPGSPLADQDLRFAINAAVDRQALSDAVFAGEAKATGITPSNLPGACDPADLPSAQLSHQEIVDLVKSSGYAGETLELVIYNSDPVLAQMAQVVQQQLDAVGVKVKIEQLDLATFLARGQQSPADLDMSLGALAGYSDAVMVSQLWNSAAGLTASFSQAHADLDALIVQAAGQPADETRAGILTDLCRTVDEYSDWVTLVHRPVVIGVNEDLLTIDLATDEGYNNVFRHLPTARLTKAAD
ncbi:ABC transporter substrate-binding protein [Nocardioides sp. LHD-245]|uniref:ABC transporter substrate-binding protein n=1 Tax=Nocardioides sp. LHD-245 TaxID=3051387 RepID=UPI0027E0D029|nr:ABC transporter substrate-binding protein [Nocardioides sp. LHD-245]